MKRRRFRLLSFFDCCAAGLLLGMPRGTLRLELLPFGVLLGGEDGGDLLHVRLADLLQLLALRLHHGLQRVELRRVVRLFRRAKLLASLLRGLEERGICVAGALLDVLDLLLLRVGEVELLCELRAEAGVPSATVTAEAVLVRSGDGQRGAEGHHCYCCHPFPV